MNVFVRIVSVSFLVCGPAAAQSVAPEVEARVRAIETELAGQGLRFVSSIPVATLGAGAYSLVCQDELERLYGTGWIEQQHYVRQALGIDAGRSPAETRVRLAQSMLAGVPVLYRTDTHSIVVDGSRVAKDARLDYELAFALCVAWRDRQSELTKLLGRPRTTESVLLAQALVYGEAHVAALGLTEGRAGRELQGTVAQKLTPPLADGVGDELTRLIHKLGRDTLLVKLEVEGRESLLRTFAEPPVTTEQLAHPIKLYKDTPKNVPLPRWPSELGLEIVREDVLGELGLYGLLLDAGVPRAVAQVAAIGWDGDRMQLFRTPDGELGVVWRVIFDRPEDVRQFGAAFTPAALGQCVARGFAVDWVRCDSVSVTQRLIALFTETKAGGARNSEDEASTAELELGLADVLDQRPRLKDGRWILPRFELTIPAPEGWVMALVGDQPYLMGPQIDEFKDNVTVVALDEKRGATIDELLAQLETQVKGDPNMQLGATEKRTLDGRQVGYARYSGTVGKHSLEMTVLIYLHGGRPVYVTASCAVANWESWSKPLIEKALGGLRFSAARAFDSE